jgi:hypothetical protein
VDLTAIIGNSDTLVWSVASSGACWLPIKVPWVKTKILLSGWAAAHSHRRALHGGVVLETSEQVRLFGRWSASVCCNWCCVELKAQAFCISPYIFPFNEKRAPLEKKTADLVT